MADGPTVRDGSAEEHTAQVPGEIRNKIENDFKSASGRTNCLVATPTLEMGVNIGALDMALMRNVPPRAANYWQRAGRAGREERMAVVVTYCRRSAHDRYFFDDPLRLLGGAIEAPTFNLRNPLMVAKHIRSAILSELLLRSRMAGESGEKVRQVVKELFPVFIRNYLLDEESHYRQTPSDTGPLAGLLTEMKDSLAARLLALFAQHWPPEAAELANLCCHRANHRPNRRRIGDCHQTTASPPYLGQLDPCRPASEEGSRAVGTGRGATAAAVRRVHQRDPAVRPVHLHAHGPGDRRVPARLWRLRGRHHGLGPARIRTSPRPADVRSEPQQRRRPTGIRPRQPALCKSRHLLRRPVSPGG